MNQLRWIDETRQNKNAFGVVLESRHIMSTLSKEMNVRNTSDSLILQQFTSKFRYLDVWWNSSFKTAASGSGLVDLNLLL